jgi:DNA mismatch repair ATPase MutL
MNQEKSKIYISKRCQHCRKLLVLLQQRPDIKGTIKIVLIDEQQQQQQQDPGQQQQQQQQQQQGQQYPGQQQHPSQHQQQLQEPSQQQPPAQQKAAQPGEDEMFAGYCEGGSCLSFSPLDDDMGGMDSPFASIDDSPSSINGKEDTFSGKGQKSQEMDNEYERMMSERGKIK